MAANLGEQNANDHIIKTKTKNILRIIIIIIIIIRVNYILSLKYKISSI